MPRQAQTLNIRLSRPAQWFTLITILASWLFGFSYIVMALFGSYGPTGSYLVFEFAYTAFPLLWFGVALTFCWRLYKSWLQRVCSATLFALIGNIAFTTLYSVEELIRMKLTPPNTGSTPPSWFASFGYQLLAALLGLLIFTGILYLAQRRWKVA